MIIIVARRGGGRQQPQQQHQQQQTVHAADAAVDHSIDADDNTPDSCFVTTMV
jgi:hypothetical protein